MRGRRRCDPIDPPRGVTLDPPWLPDMPVMTPRPAQSVPPAAETVDHPPHYNAHPSGVECIDVVEHMSFNLGNAIKYIWRADEKGRAVEDLRKARWYLDRELARRESAP